MNTYSICQFFYGATQCRRFPPTVTPMVLTKQYVGSYGQLYDDEGKITTKIESKWPQVEKDSWCGEWKEK